MTKSSVSLCALWEPTTTDHWTRYDEERGYQSWFCYLNTFCMFLVVYIIEIPLNTITKKQKDLFNLTPVCIMDGDFLLPNEQMLDL